ncbi:MAG: hypothetical protein A2020_12470 [Lentisphaerae bacterium GWF2_45_14]|nr:MAG: hypothetical protein A2020_12470 [Lentisphaerae bacterium GWF2_45_14]
MPLLLRKNIILTVLLFISAGQSVFADLNLAPLIKYEEYSPVDNADAYYLRALGPLIYSRRTAIPEKTVWAVCPLFSTLNEKKSSQLDILWPFCEFKEYWYESRGRALFYSHFHDKIADSGSFAVFPFFSYDSGSDEGKSLTFFPLYGELRKIFLYDSIYFIVFPLYVKTKRGQVTEHSILWPFVSFAEGEAGRKYRIMPFYGVNIEEGGSHSGFIMWPFYTYSLFRNRAGNFSGGWMLWPFLGRCYDKNTVSWSSIWPLFEVSLKSNDSSLCRLDMLWPFFQYRDDFPYAGESRLYFWPFYGNTERSGQEKSFYLWPFARTRTTSSRDGKIKEEILKAWPFLSYESNADRIRISCPDLWLLDSFSAVERNWKPLWTIFDFEQSSHAGRMEILWGLFSYRNGSDGRNEFSISPFYSVHWEDTSSLTEHDFLGGLFSLRTGAEDGFHLKLFKLLEF